METNHLYRRVRRILLGVTFSIATTLPAVGAESAGPVRLDVGSGILAAGGRVSVKDHGRKRRIDASVGPAAALAVGYQVSNYVDVLASGEGASTGASDRTSYGKLGAGARIYPLGRALRVRPWLIGEAGWVHAKAAHTVTVRNNSNCLIFCSRSHTQHWNDNGANLEFGGGLDVPIGTHFSIGPDVRYHQTVGVFDDPGHVTAMLNLSFHIGSTDSE